LTVFPAFLHTEEKPEIFVQMGHTDWVKSVAFTRTFWARANDGVTTRISSKSWGSTSSSDTRIEVIHITLTPSSAS
jgi:hypothetical protein